jgi:hypothetical protein
VQNTLTLLCIGPFILAELEEQKKKKSENRYATKWTSANQSG